MVEVAIRQGGSMVRGHGSTEVRNLIRLAPLLIACGCSIGTFAGLIIDDLRAE